MITTALTRSAGELRSLVKRRPFRLSGKVIVITGGAGGIGSEMARRCAAGGATIVVVDLDAARCQAVVDSLPTPPSASPGHLGVPLDLTDRDQIAALVRRVDEHAGRIDVLVNNAGMTSAERFGDRSLDSMEDEIRLNTLSPLFVTRLTLDLLRRSADPRVINTVSLAGMFPEAETPIYCASKFALRGAMLSIAMDFKAEGIKVSSVLPSATDTRMLQREAIEGGNLLQFQNPPQSAGQVVDTMISLLDRPRLEAYPRPAEARLVRATMAFPNLLFVLLPFFEGKGESGHKAYLAELLQRGAIIKTDDGYELAP